jgi:1-acyl-sn-glycerol-3-phosphate acyltransferase
MFKDWVFHFCRNSLRLPLGGFVRKIHFDGFENFPKDKPVLLAGNHPNSFLDGVVYEHMSGRKMYTLTRGDVFLKPLPNYLFRSMRLRPIFRARDANSEVARKGNTQTMDELYDLFTKNETVLIFSEGSSYPEKAVRRLRKGTGHIAIDMAKRSDYNLNLHIVPTAVNYSKFGSLMQTIHVSFDKPIAVKDYKEAIQENEKKVAEQFTNMLQESLENHVVITKGDFTVEKEFLQELMINENYRPFTFKSINTWELSIAKLNSISESTAKKVRSYMKSLRDFDVDDANVGGRSFDAISVFIALFTFGVSLPTYIVWRLIWQFSMSLIDKKIKNVVFHDSLKVGIAMILSLFLVTGVTIFFFNWVSPLWAILLTAGSTYGGICWFRLVDLLPYFWKQLAWFGMKEKDKDELSNQRKEIVKAIA